jgi:hypothetical protein
MVDFVKAFMLLRAKVVLGLGFSAMQEFFYAQAKVARRNSRHGNGWPWITVHRPVLLWTVD